MGAGLQDVTRLAREMAHAKGVDEVLALAVEQLFARVQPDFLILHIREGNVLHVKRVLPAENVLSLNPDCIPAVGACFCGRACSENRFVSSVHASEEGGCSCIDRADANIRAFAAVPVMLDDEIIAVLGFGSKEERDFRAEQGYIEALAAQVGVVVSNVSLRAGLEAALKEERIRLKQQQALQKELGLEAEFNRVLIDHAAEGISVSHRTEEPPHVAFTVWNRKMTELTGYTMEEINRLGWFDVLFPDPVYREIAIARTRRIRDGVDLDNEEWTIRHRDGSERVISMSSCNFDEIAVRHTLVVLDDRTAERQAQQQSEALRDELQGMMRMSALGEAASGILHELNQPLAAVATNTASLQAMLKRRIEDRDVVRSLVDAIEADTQRAAALVGRLRQYLRKGHPLAKHKPCDLHDLILAVVKILDGTLQREDITLHLALAQSSVKVVGDKMELEQVIMNLVLNAIDALQDISAHRNIEIATRVEADGMVHCVVRDNGKGFAPEVRTSAFEPFVSNKRSGLGLGLPICKRIIEAHGGAVSIGEDIGKGAEVRFSLPVVRT